MTGRSLKLSLPLIGAYQAANVLVAAGLAMATGTGFDRVFSAMQRVAPVRGRLERAVISREGVPVYVDYAHTPDALEAAIAALRPHVDGRLITVFGAGGDRDQGKRPEMGAVAARLSDIVIVTDDNPRSEDPAVIRSAIMAGAPSRDRGRRPPRSHRRGDPHGARGRHHPLRRQGPRDRPDRRRPACFRSTMPWWLGNARRERRSGPRDEIAAATGGTASAPFEVTGVTFDSREVGPGDLFVAMPGTVHDGHKFVASAFAAGAAGALVSQPVEGPHVLVDDVFAALQALGRASRERSKATIIGVTGSVGKTSTKEALYAALDRNRPGKVHRSVKSYNNHTGVPLSLARMPRDAEFAVLEMGMNNAGEIAALTSRRSARTSR